MNGKELLLKAIKNELTPRPAWLPFVGVHGAKIIGKTATEYLKSTSIIVQGLKKAKELYKPDGLPIVFDLQLEAEILGCELKWSDDTPPSVKTHPLESGKSLADLPVFSVEEGRFPAVLEALRILKKDIGDDTALYGLICGPFTLALHLLGNGIFMQMFDHPDYVNAVISYCSNVGKKTAKAYLDAGADVVAVVDPMVSQIRPKHFSEFISAPLNNLFEFIRANGGYSSLFVCGDATRNLEKMAQTKCDNISIDENIPLENVRDYTRSNNKSFGGNLKLTAVLLLGDEDDSKLDAIRCIDIGGGAGFILAPGCDLPYATPEANIQAVALMAHDAYQREIAKRAIIVKSADDASVELPNYAKEPNVIIDVVTLDSSSCAPCQYMVDAVQRLTPQLKKPIVVREHRITTRTGIAMMKRLNVSNIPSICIDGILTFSSLIPDQKTLIEAIEKAQSKKK